MIKHQLSLLIFLCFISLSATAQTITIEGKVTTFDVIKVMQAEVTAKKAKVTVLTDSLGVFAINVT